MKYLYIVLHVSCSELGFASPTILGIFHNEKDATSFKKEKCTEISSYYKIFVLKGEMKIESPTKIITDLPEDVKNGYTVA